jgi:hypothetical protein
MVTLLCELGAQGAGLAFRDDSDISRALANYIMSGKVPGTNSFVFSGNEAAEILGYAGRQGKATGFRSRLLFSFDPAITGVSNMQGYSFSPGADPTLLYFIEDLPVFIELGVDVWSGDSVAGKVKMDLALRQNYLGTDFISLYTPWDIDSLIWTFMSWRFPQEGWISAGNENAWIAAGRFKAGLGEGHFGNTFLSTRAEWYDQVQGAIGNKNFRFTALVGTSSTFLNKTEGEIQFLPRDDYDAGNNSINPWDPINDHDFSDQNEAVKMFAYRQVEARFWDRLRIGIGEMNMIGGKDPSLADLLPTGFWHNNYSAGFTNVMLNINASLVPLDGLLLFGEFTLDDFRGADEGSTGKPAQFAWQAGGRYSFKPLPSVIVTTGGEYSLANEWIYCRWQPYLTMYQRHQTGPSWGTDWPLGFTYGPDARHVGLFAQASFSNGANVELSYEYLEKGPIYMGMTDADGDPIYYDYDDRTDNTKDSSLAAIRALPDQLSHAITVKVSYPLPKGFEVLGTLQYWNHSNYRNASGDSRQFFLYSAGVRWKY